MVNRIICIAVEDYKHLTVGKTYEIVDILDEHDDVRFADKTIIIINDGGHKGLYESRLFTTLSAIRNNKLNELGI